MVKTKLQQLTSRLLSTPLIVWILLGFLISFLICFIRPIFFSENMMQFPQYVPASNPSGKDLNNTLVLTRELFVNHKSPYFRGDNYTYPPLTSLLSLPFLFAGHLAYPILSLLTIFCFVGISFVLLFKLNKDQDKTPILILILVTGILSYGFQFELERGQFNLIAMTLCLLGIWIFHRKKNLRFLAYVLFSISIQLKIYPAIFAFLLIDDWRDWKNNLRRILFLGLANFALLFALGPALFLDFIKALIQHTNNPFVWVANHSIRSFIALLCQWASTKNYSWIGLHSNWIEYFLLALVGICFLLILVKSYRQNVKGIHPVLLLACTIVALVIPPASHDYTLSILAVPVAILLADKEFWTSGNPARPHLYPILLLILFSATYSSTLFSYLTKPYLLAQFFQNDFSALLTLLIILTVLFIIPKKNPVQ